MIRKTLYSLCFSSRVREARLSRDFQEGGRDRRSLEPSPLSSVTPALRFPLSVRVRTAVFEMKYYTSCSPRFLSGTTVLEHGAFASALTPLGQGENELMDLKLFVASYEYHYHASYDRGGVLWSVFFRLWPSFRPATAVRTRLLPIDTTRLYCMTPLLPKHMRTASVFGREASTGRFSRGINPPPPPPLS